MMSEYCNRDKNSWYKMMTEEAKDKPDEPTCAESCS
jgi:hypothetical protein